MNPKRTGAELARQAFSIECFQIDMCFSGVPYENRTSTNLSTINQYLSIGNHNGILLEFSRLKRCSQKQINAQTRIKTRGMGPKKDRLESQKSAQFEESKTTLKSSYIDNSEFTTGPQREIRGDFMARHTNGWIKIYRAAILGDIGANFIRAGLFNALVAFANLQSSTVVWKGQPRKIDRGELVTSLQELADLGEIDRKTVNRHLKYLEKRNTILVERSSTGTFIKILNYEQYQGQDAEGSTRGPHDRDCDRDNEVHTIGTHNKELKNKRNKELKNSLEFDLNFEFKRLAKKYRDLFPGTTTGPKALDQFKVQFKTPADIQDLETSFAHYRELLNESDWRKPKGTFAAYMGTKSSGHFWKDFIEKPNLVTSNSKDPFAFLFEGKDEPA